jgi:GTP-binding protein
VSQGRSTDVFNVSGRGLMHIGILLENLRRESYEVTVGKPRVVTKEVDGKIHEPIELLVVDVPVAMQSAVMSLIGNRRAEIVSMDGKPGASGFVHLEFTIPARGLVGLRGRMMTATQGEAIMHHSFFDYGPWRGDIPHRTAGVMVATEKGRVTAYSIDNLYDRGFFFVAPGDEVYEGQIVGEHNRDNDISVNIVRAKKQTNIRTHAKDDTAALRPPRRLGLEAALEYISEDELVEVTPDEIRMRKRILGASERKRESRRGSK